MQLAIKLLIVVLLLFIILNLGRALVMMLRSKDAPLSMSHFLGRRVALSAFVLVLLILAMMGGWIEPNPRPY
ncbi:DUF2909 domain-containing protein [Ferrimonas sediminicola]|uniref:DUF2909 domain-containing protein n=1 Tax=Ferrimonas sediminicola TaxID=2569538 RepID=A0A4U1BB16_9GAMM|nr:DUF2909 domain-containing protein [Ferrimonas sediminicola]TKB47617.1 DUF2909 domain-containing protein [Ferrimonas sediminicola]